MPLSGLLRDIENILGHILLQKMLNENRYEGMNNLQCINFKKKYQTSNKTSFMMEFDIQKQR